jgi:hypothetical protein
LESIDLVAYKNPVPADGACVVAGADESFDDGKGMSFTAMCHCRFVRKLQEICGY